MKVEPKIVAAIMGAISLYIQAERAEAVEEAPPRVEARAPAPWEKVVYGQSPWVIAGRQAAMEMRRLWQMRLAR